MENKIKNRNGTSFLYLTGGNQCVKKLYDKRSFISVKITSIKEALFIYLFFTIFSLISYNN